MIAAAAGSTRAATSVVTRQVAALARLQEAPTRAQALSLGAAGPAGLAWS